MLHEESWIPFDVTYDVTAWSNPLLMNLDGGWTGEDVDPAATARRRPVGAGRPGTPPAARRRSACSRSPTAPAASRPPARRRYLFEQVWDLPYTRRRRPPTSSAGLGPDDRRPGHPRRLRELRACRRSARRASGPSATGSTPAAGSSPGRAAPRSRSRPASRRVKFGDIAHEHARARSSACRVDDASPLATGVGDRDWVMYQDDRTMQPGLGDGGRDVSRPPATPDFATSGLAIGVDTLAGTAAVVDEAVGSGRVVSFSIDPNFRAWTAGHAADAVERDRRAETRRLRPAAPPAPGRGRRPRRRPRTPPRRCPTSGRRSASGSPARTRRRRRRSSQRHGAEVVRSDVDGDDAVPRRQP